MARNYLGGVLPIGSVIHSMLTTAQFQSEMGSNWVLADGSSCTGTKYASITGATAVPDMRGKFLRGKNNGASGANYNPDGDLSLGTFESDKTRSHSHLMTTVGKASGSGTGFVYDSGLGQATIFSTEATSGTETSPKAITVNYFIRVN